MSTIFYIVPKNRLKHADWRCHCVGSYYEEDLRDFAKVLGLEVREIDDSEFKGQLIGRRKDDLKLVNLPGNPERRRS